MLSSYILILLLSPLSLATIYIMQGNRSVDRFNDRPALFGPSVPIDEDIQGFVVKANPLSGCSVLDPPPKVDGYYGPFIAIVKRFNCSFVDKVLNAQKAGYKAVIVRNVGSNDMEYMSGGKNGSKVMIPSVFVGEGDGILIETHYLYYYGYGIIIFNDTPFDIKDYLLPFAITIGICFLLLLSITIVKCFREYRQSRRYRLSYSNLKKIPIHKFKKGDPYECCAVCLEDYVDNEKLRVLPCAHAYHSKCIDPWLTKNRRVCPVCKRKVLIGNEKPSDLDSDSEDETAPLLHAAAVRDAGTFASQAENPFVAAESQASRYNILQEEDDASQGNTSESEARPQTSASGYSDTVVDVQVVSTSCHSFDSSATSSNLSTTANIV